MALDVEQLLRETGALLHGHFRLSSGLHSGDYVQCALLLEHPRNAKRVGVELAERIRPMAPAKIVSPALGGVIVGYAAADALDLPFVFTERKDGQMTLRRGFRLERDRGVVIVEDVVTTGKSTRETAEVVAPRVDGGWIRSDSESQRPRESLRRAACQPRVDGTGDHSDASARSARAARARRAGSRYSR